MTRVKLKAETTVIVPEANRLEDEDAVKERGRELGTYTVEDLEKGEGPLGRFWEKYVTEVEIVEDD